MTSPTTVKAVTGPHLAGTVPISITTPSGTVTSTADFKYEATAPVITGFTPTSGTATGTTSVTIAGNHFTAATEVTFGTTTAKTFTVTSPTTITAVTNPHPGGAVHIKVVTPGGSVTSTGTFTFISTEPNITGFTPTSGPITGTTTVLITGTHFTGATKVTFGTTTAMTFTVTSPTTISAVTRPHSGGTVKIAVTTPMGWPPVGHLPVRGPPTHRLLLHTDVGDDHRGRHGDGHRHPPDRGLGRPVRHSSRDAVHVASSTSLTVKTPAHPAGPVTVSVTTPGGTATSASDYTFVQPAPTATTLTPGLGSATGGTVVTITGTHLTGLSAVSFGTVPSTTFSFTGPTKAKATTRPTPPAQFGSR